MRLLDSNTATETSIDESFAEYLKNLNEIIFSIFTENLIKVNNFFAIEE